MNYLLKNAPTCVLQIDSVQLTLQGHVKLGMGNSPLFIQADHLVPDIHYQHLQEECISDHQYSSAFLAGILEVLMSHGTSNDEGWSKEALEFSSLSSSDSMDQYVQVSLSMQTLISPDRSKHAFLSKAVSSSRLVPRIRLATQMLGLPTGFFNHN
jgi:hypothetical protein